MNIMFSGAAAQGASGAAQIALKPASTPDKAEVAADAAKARSNNSFSASDWAKSQARSRLQQIMDRLKVLKKLFANDPKGMAKALAQAFKELKAAVKDYSKAMGDEFSAVGGVVSQALTQGSGADGQAPGDGQAQPVAASPDHALYDAVNTAVRKGLGEEGLDFLKDVRSMVNALSDELDSARTQMRAKKPEKDMTDAFDDADKSMKDVRDALGDLEQDIHTDAPMAGLKLSIAA